MTDHRNGLIVRFGPFEADLAAGQLRKHGLRIKVQDQPFTILATFLEHPGEVVTRDQLRQRLWTEGTFVDFDNSLNAAINKLREALGDSAENPRYVETLPRRGYRFIAPIQNGNGHAADTVAASSAPAALQSATPASVAAPAAPPALAHHAPPAPSATPLSAPAPSAPPVIPASLAVRANVWLSIAALVAALALIVFFTFRNFGPRASAASGKTMLAVLPFQNISGDTSQDYLSDGLTEELIAQLSRMQPERLGVIARSTAMQYRQTPKGIDQIARELGIRYAIEGSVRRDGERIRITAQLIQVSDQTHVWAATYERNVKDVLAIQQDVASQVVRELATHLLPPGASVAARASTSSPEAYDAYTRARFFWGKRTQESVKRSIELYQQAIQKDPNYALAYVGLADSYYVWGGRLSGLPPSEAYARADVAVKKALELDPSLAEAHIARSAVLFDHHWNFAEAEKELRRGLELNPSYAMGHQWHAEFLASTGRTEEALQAIDRSLALDPFSRAANLVRGQILMYLRRYDESIDQFRKLAEIDASFLPAQAHLARVYRAQGKPAEWFASYTKWLQLLGEKPEALNAYSEAFRTGGMEAVLRLRLKTLIPQAGNIYGAPYAIARIYAVLRDNDQALNWLARAAEQRDDFASHITVDPEFDALRSDPRFQQLLRRIGFPQFR